MSWFANVGVVIITLLVHVGGIFGVFNPSHNPSDKQSVTLSALSDRPTASPSSPSSTQISAGARKSVASTTSPMHNLYNLPTSPVGSDSCYVQIDDAVFVYFNNGIEQRIKLPGADLETFQNVSASDYCFGKDKDNVYFYDQVLEWADPKTFSVLTYFRGPVLFLANRHEIVSWRPPGDYSPDIAQNCTPGVSQGFCVVPGGDPATFQTILGAYDIAPWATDRNNVYCAGRIIQHAYPASVLLVHDGRYLSVVADDTRHLYRGCTVVDEAANM